ncbi:MAG TPA: hypothetical protein VKS79_20650 [Gemmataceae bacterium]|nr:hypothetical protein [Gemmataceae bacterium]
MHTVICHFCKREFKFDPERSDSTTRRLRNLEAGTHLAMLVQCQSCRHWIMLKLDDDEPHTDEWDTE